MTQHLMSFYSLLWIYFKHFLEEIVGLAIYAVVEWGVEVKFHSAVVLVDLVEFSSWEELAFCEEDMEDDASGKDITNWADFLSLSDLSYFRGNVPWSSTAIEYV